LQDLVIDTAVNLEGGQEGKNKDSKSNQKEEKVGTKTSFCSHSPLSLSHSIIPNKKHNQL